MSVVVDMPMPKNCDTCFFCGVFYSEVDGHGDYYCGALWQLLKRKKYHVDHPRKGRLPNCPIICQLPEGHGRLVDADAYDYPGDLKWEPTIVPTERSET